MSGKTYIIPMLLLLLCQNINAQSLNKATLCNDKFYLPSMSVDSFIFVEIIDIKNFTSTDTLYLISKLRNRIGACYNNPISWNVAKNKLYFIDTYEDHLGMNYAQLKMFDFSEIERSKLIGNDSLQNYLISTKRIKSRTVVPIEKYAMMSRYNIGDVKGKIYFDMLDSEDHLWVFVYLDSLKRMEAWEFSRYPIIQGIIEPFEKGKIAEIYKRDPWIKVSSQDLTIFPPFKVLNTLNKNYVIDYTGQVFEFESALYFTKKETTIKDIKKSLFIEDQSQEGVLTIKWDKIAIFKNNMSTKKLNELIENIRIE
jgi:hypothetical protein